MGSPCRSGRTNYPNDWGSKIITVIYFWKIPSKAIPFAIIRMALDRLSLRRNRAITFYKLLGCGHGRSFLPSDADPRRWGLLVCIDEKELEELDSSRTLSRWRAKSTSEFRAVLNPLSSHGQWSGKEPFNFRSTYSDTSREIVAITRARIAWTQYPRFLRAIPPVSADVKTAPGLLNSFGIGEAPIGLQGTFSYWESNDALRNFAFRGEAHAEAISATKKFNWYSEELFARFAVVEIRGAL